jgi:Family of unknown function (DUF6502)
MASTEARKQLLYALRRVLRPVIQILIRAGIRFDEFSELARGVYIESAIRGGIDHPTPPTRERIALATGVTRQQVDHYIENEKELPVAEPTLARVAVEVLHKWHTDSQYLGSYGIPLELEFEGITGRDFRRLVSSVERKVSAGVVLDELLRAGSVISVGDNHFRTISRAFVPSEPMSPQQLEYFGHSLRRLANTLEHNFNPNNADKRLERFVAADRGIPRELLPKFESFARDRANLFLNDLDNWLAPHSGADVNDARPRVEAGVNVFLYVDPPDDPRPLSSIIQQPSARRD